MVICDTVYVNLYLILGLNTAPFPGLLTHSMQTEKLKLNSFISMKN
jgi:hypothetical protein